VSHAEPPALDGLRNLFSEIRIADQLLKVLVSSGIPECAAVSKRDHDEAANAIDKIVNFTQGIQDAALKFKRNQAGIVVFFGFRG
jgi:hypothetical protein